MSLRAWSCFAAVSVLWGVPYLFIKLAVDDGIPPLFVAWARVAITLGVAVLGESIGAGAVAGLLLILAGSWLATDGRLPPGLRRIAGRTRRAPRPARRPGADLDPATGRA